MKYSALASHNKPKVRTRKITADKLAHQLDYVVMTYVRKLLRLLEAREHVSLQQRLHLAESTKTTTTIDQRPNTVCCRTRQNSRLSGA